MWNYVDVEFDSISLCLLCSCGDKSSCQMPVNNEVFDGDPCDGIYKYLEVQYECGMCIFSCYGIIEVN